MAYHIDCLTDMSFFIAFICMVIYTVNIYY